LTVMPQFRARSAGLQPGISPNADLKVGATSAVAPETEALQLTTYGGFSADRQGHALLSVFPNAPGGISDLRVEI
jgi:hypothetical protein